MILAASAMYLGWAYRAGGRPAKVAERGHSFVPPSVVRGPGGPMETDCCTFVAGVLASSFPAARWTGSSWGDLMIADVAKPWSGIDAIVGAGVGLQLDLEREVMVDGQWYVVQGWSGLRGGRVVAGAAGHTWFSRGPDLLLQASSSAQKVCWTERPWNLQRRRYDEVRVVRLNEV